MSKDLVKQEQKELEIKKDQISTFMMSKEFQQKLEMALGRTMDPGQFSAQVLTVINTTPALQKCAMGSLTLGVLSAASLCLPFGPLGLCYLMPRWISKWNQHRAVFILGYKGIIQLALRDPRVEMVHAEVVYHGDEFRCEYGSNHQLVHVPCEDAAKRGEIRGVYTMVHMGGKRSPFKYLPLDDVLAYQKRSDAKNDGPWKTDFEAMAKKTSVRRIQPWIPQVISLAEGVAKEDTSYVAANYSSDGGGGDGLVGSGSFGELPEIPDLVTCSIADCGKQFEEVRWLETASRHKVDRNRPLCPDHLAANEKPALAAVSPPAQKQAPKEEAPPPPTAPPRQPDPPKPTELPKETQEQAKCKVTNHTPPREPKKPAEEKPKAPKGDGVREKLRDDLMAQVVSWSGPELKALDRQLMPVYGMSYSQVLEKGNIEQLSAMAAIIDRMG